MIEIRAPSLCEDTQATWQVTRVQGLWEYLVGQSNSPRKDK